MQQPTKQASSICVGILASDPLRSIGLQSILEEGLKVRTLILGSEGRPRGQKLHALIIDQGADELQAMSAPLSRALAHMPGVAVVILARQSDSTAVTRILEAGARAVLPETAQIADIRACLRAVLRGKTWTPRDQVAADGQSEAEPKLPPRLSQRFTPKEREVMRCLGQGRSNREIALTMGIDEATVKAHLGRMLRKAKASNRVELTLRALADQRATGGTE